MKAWAWSVVTILAITAAIIGGVFWSESRTSRRLASDTEAVGLAATPTDMDVYDGAAWSAVTELSERSIADRSRPVDFPDFTRGAWRTRRPLSLPFASTGV